jgi:integrase/recombinase XerD
MNLVVVNPQHVRPNQGSLVDLIQMFLDAQDVAESSKRTYERQLRQFVNWLHDTGRGQNLGQLRREDILSFKHWLSDAGKSSYTVSGYITVVRKLFQWLESEKVYPDVTRNIKGAKRAKGFRKDCLTPRSSCAF